MSESFFQLDNFKKSKLLAKVLRKKDPDALIEASKESGLNKTLTGMDLVILGVGAIIGTGIFSLSGLAVNGAVDPAGPSFMLSCILASIVCIFSALSYSEFASMIPVAGSAYTYTYTTLGELAGWLMGWILILEYAIGNITVVKSWSYYLFHFLKGFPMLPDWMTNQAYWIFNYQFLGLNLDINIPSLFVLAVITAMLYKGVQESAKLAALMVYLKVGVIILFIAVGAFYVTPQNWVPFAPSGLDGVFQGTFIILLAYIGFDAVSTAAEETKNPGKDVPFGIIGSLVVCMVVYAGVAAVLTGMMPYNLVDQEAPIAAALTYVDQNWVAGFLSLGALAGLTSVLLVLQLGTTRILLAMARDKFLPSMFQKIHPRHKTPHVLTVATGIFVAVGALIFSLKDACDISNVGAIFAFSIVSISIIILRKTDPDRKRPFKVPFSPWVPLMGVASCWFIIYKGVENNMAILYGFILWVLAGVAIYFLYGYKKTDDVVIETSKKD